MNDGMYHIDCEQAHQMVDRSISGELTPDERRMFDAHLAGCTTCSELLRSLESVRNIVRRAVGNQAVPVALGANVRSALAREQGAVNTPPNPLSRGGLRNEGREDGNSSGVPSWWRYAVAAAVAVILFGSWYFFVADRGDQSTIVERSVDSLDSTPTASPVEAEVAQVLNIGVLDHIGCAVTFHSSPDLRVTPEEILSGMKEYAGLVPIVRERLKGYRVTVAHQCTIRGRDYIHMILHRGDTMVSIAITKKKQGETFPGQAIAAATESSTPIYQARVDDYQSSGFQTDRYLVFAIANQTREENLRIASALAAPVTEFLGKVKVG
jgi:anti-sigma factor (TIGR02949 family)